ncbi:MAG: DUF11 domain-containing protein [Anaerolineae bacterium]|nr:DUF11 domain-containing protein [Anaerolineae bacterium]
MSKLRYFIIGFLPVVALVVLLVYPVFAATITVTNGNDSGPGSLRQAIADAQPGDTITFAGDTAITLANPLVINKNLTIDGETHAVTVSGNDAVRVFQVYTDTHVTFDSLTIAHGKVITPEIGDHPAGGGVKIEAGAVVTLTNSTVFSNIATYDADPDPASEDYYGHGGGVYNLGALTVINATFADNVASSRTGYVNGDGGAIYNRGTLVVTDSAFTGNAAESGGAIYNRSGATLTVESSTISGNSAPCGGAGISSRGTATVSDSTIADNVAPKPPDWSCESDAAGIGNSGGTMTVSRSTISGNINEDGSGGGLSSYGSNPDQGHLTVLDSTIYNNVANSHGGGIYNWWDSVLTVTNSSIYSNTANWYGGGILSGGSQNTKLTLINSTLSCNMAQDGGGLCNGTPVGFAGEVLSMTNSTVVSNTATGSGGGVYNWNSASVTLDNIILWGNTAPAGPQIYNNSTNRPTISANDIQGSGGSGACWDTALGTDGGGNIDNNPLFVDAATGNLRLHLNSPAIDAGNNSAVPGGLTTDLAGAPRFMDVPTVTDTGSGTPPIVDMGAYETGPALTLEKSVAPETNPQGVVTYTLVLSNTGALSDIVTLTDTLPGGVDFGGWVSHPAGMAQHSNTLTWTGTITAGDSVTAIFTATITGSSGGTIANTAHFSGTNQTGLSSAAFTLNSNSQLYLPVIWKQ